ncbi:SpoIIE family protein phosphatase [Streptomyces sp. S.PB5]|uniref:SpoIIE family protein phosphatase n=1 Tax=Streptomyces sp. S.PB5 TaxID=3020844 RepID=UPI0025B18964|nr:SpoIIE family protein phosphatase [Streptomyces sp. S.PB5]MDN3021876.1 SpoIIE family protein phosphatase [Streptomyces sp. S.PB5]
MGPDSALPRTLLSEDVETLLAGATAELGREYRVLREIVEGGAAAVAVLDTRLRYVYVNPHMARIVGVPAEEQLGRNLAEIIPGVERPEEVPLAVLRDGRPRDVLIAGNMGTGDGRKEREWHSTYHRLKNDHGEIVGLVAIGVEVTEPRRYLNELERTHGRMAMLHAATLRIGTTLDLSTTCQELTDFVVRDLADGASVELVVENESVHPRPSPSAGVMRMRRAAVSVRPELAVRLGGLAGPEDVNDHGPGSPMRRCLERGRPFVTSMPTRVRPETRGPYADRLARYRAAGIHSTLVVPLRTDSRSVGVLAMVRSGSSPGFTAEDAVVAQELAGRASHAMERAQRYAREHTMALELQRALLSEPTLPHPDLETASRYLPADDSAVVGGDWYDSLALPHGRNLLVIGDVMGHGVEAAVAMSHYRSMLRALASSGLPLHEMLAAADRMVAGSGFDRVATCLLALGDPATDTISYANAGHLPPLRILPDGRVELVPLSAGPPLGTGMGGYETVTRPSLPGGVLLLYTDGLVERRDEDIDTSLQRLTELRLQPGGDLDEILDGILAHAATGAARDDIALLAARARGA